MVASVVPMPDQALLRRWAARLEGERERWILWLPVAVGTGIGLYFALPFEPSPWPPTGLAVLAAAAAAIAGRLPAARMVAIAVAALALGLAAAAWHTRSVAAPALAQRLPAARLTGRVVALTRTVAGVQVLLDQVALAGASATDTPARVRIVVRGTGPPPEPGDRVTLRAALEPPSPPSMPGAPDFQRIFFFQRIGALGYARSPLTRLATAPTPLSWEIRLNRVRAHIAVAAMAALPGPRGQIAAAILAGDRGAIAPALAEAMRNAGLAHILVVAGLHIGMVAACVRAAVRLGFAAIPWLALRLPTKKIATVVALLAAVGYAALAGFTIPTQRAFVMGGLALAAVLIDRWALSMRMLGVAALVILLAAPDQLVGPSFQMSFAAVASLIAGYEILGPRLSRWRRAGGWARGLAVHGAGLAITSALVTLGTAPYSAWAFDRIAVYGVLANLIAVPVTAVLILPAGLLAVLLMPAGLEWIGLAPMGWGIDLVLWSATVASGLPGAVVPLAHPSAASILVVTLGGLWICLWRGRHRWLGAPAVMIGLVLMVTARLPDLIVSPTGSMMAVRGPDGLLRLSPHAPRATRESWLALTAAERGPDLAPDQASADGPACDEAGCVLRLHGRLVALSRTPDAIADDCAKADLMISVVPVRGRCRAVRVIDRFTLWRTGAQAIWVAPDAITVTTVRDTRGIRPWAPAPHPRGPSISAAAPPAGPAP